jgi:microcystin-dependent protein
MAHVVEDRILESTITTGVGDITLTAGLVGFRRFNVVCAVGDTVNYFIEAIDSQGLPSGDYEYGIGTYSAADTLTRTKVLGSSNAGALVAFGTGTKNVGIPALASSLVPTGARMEFLGTIVQPGYLELDGTLKSRLQYPSLWAYAQASGILLGSDAAWAGDKGKFSPGDGATTFRLPDHRGMHAKAWDHGAGIDAGRAIGSYQADDVKAHNHGVTDPGHPHVVNDPQHAHQTIPGGGTARVLRPDVAGGGFYGAGSFTTTDIASTGSAATGVTVNAGATGITIQNAGGTETRVKNIAVLVCVKT